MAIKELKKPGIVTKGILLAFVWVTFVSLFSFGFLLVELFFPSGEEWMASVSNAFQTEFSRWGTFIAMLGILFFLIFDYVIHRDSGLRDDRGGVHYPARVFFCGIAVAALATIIFLLTINVELKNAFGFHDTFNEISWPLSFFMVYLLSIGYIRYVTIHDTRMRRHTLEKISTQGAESIPWE